MQLSRYYKSYYFTPALILCSIIFVVYAIHASLRYEMSWYKFILFWIGSLGIASFLLNRILARVKSYQSAPSIPKYTLRHRIVCSSLLVSWLFCVFVFSFITIRTWQKPALYWELEQKLKPSSNHFQTLWRLGNQHDDRSVWLNEIKLIALANIALDKVSGKITSICKVDSISIAGKNSEQKDFYFRFPQGFEIGKLESHLVQLDFIFRQNFAIFEITAIYQNYSNGENSHEQKTVSTESYVIIEPPYAKLADFLYLKSLVHQSSVEIKEAVILAIGKSKHPDALKTLLDLLPIRDIRIQNTVCEALNELKDSKAVPALIELVNASDNSRAIRTLADIGSNDAVDFLIGLIANPDRPVFLRVTAASTISAARLEHGASRLASLIVEKKIKNSFIQREILIALGKLDRPKAQNLIPEIIQQSYAGQDLRNLIEVIVELNLYEAVSHFSEWLLNWQQYELTIGDVQVMLDFIVSRDLQDMVGVLIDAFGNERDTRIQRKYEKALTKLAGKNFGHIQHPVLNHKMNTENQKIVASWNDWWANTQPDQDDHSSIDKTAEKM